MVRRVTVSGYRSGSYDVTEENPDGSLVITPVISDRPPTPRRPRLSGLQRMISRPPPPQDLPEILSGWGVELAWDESVTEFQRVDVDDTAGFAAITTHRLLFMAMGRGRTLETRWLSSVRRVEPARRGRRQSLRVTWEGSEWLIVADNADALVRLRAAIEAPTAP